MYLTNFKYFNNLLKKIKIDNNFNFNYFILFFFFFKKKIIKINNFSFLLKKKYTRIMKNLDKFIIFK